MKLLEHVRKLLDGKNAHVTNADITIVAEKPKLAKFIPDMQRSIAAALGLDTDVINVKATHRGGSWHSRRGYSRPTLYVWSKRSAEMFRC